MRIPLPAAIQPTHEMLTLIAAIDEFKGEWRALGRLGPETLRSLRRIATIESVGSSTRIEGAKLSDSEVEKLVSDLGKEPFQSRDQQEVGGYAYVMETIQTAWQDLRISESILLQLHRDLLRYSNKDERHRGEWKPLNNHVAAFDADGEQIGIVFETASPFETPLLMEKLLGWYAKEEAISILHPLLRIAVFNVILLAIHPFQDGNGRLFRVLTNLMLLRAAANANLISGSRRLGSLDSLLSAGTEIADRTSAGSSCGASGGSRYSRHCPTTLATRRASAQAA